MAAGRRGFVHFFARLLPAQAVQLSLAEHLRIVPLAQNLVRPHGDAVRQVQAAGARIRNHRNPHAVFLIGHQQLLGKSGRFLAEHQVTAVRIGDGRVRPARFR